MKNSAKLIVESWRRFLSEGMPDDPGQTQDPEEPVSGERLIPDHDMMGDFDREVQGPETYVPDEMIVEEILEYLHTNPKASDEELVEMFDAYEEDIQEARSKFDSSMMTRQQDEMDMDSLDMETGSDYDSQMSGFPNVYDDAQSILI